MAPMSSTSKILLLGPGSTQPYLGRRPSEIARAWADTGPGLTGVLLSIVVAGATMTAILVTETLNRTVVKYWQYNSSNE